MLEVKVGLRMLFLIEILEALLLRRSCNQSSSERAVRHPYNSQYGRSRRVV